MFQYAIGRRLAVKHKTSLKLDLSFFYSDVNKKSEQVRHFSLDKFNISAEIATRKDLKFLGIPQNKFLLSLLKRNIWYKNKRYVKEGEQNKFNANILSISDDVYLDGYWQSELYFKDIEEIIKNDLTFTGELSKSSILFKNKIDSTDAVSLHIRRTDYITFGFDILSVDYYSNAIKKISDIVKKPTIFVFSDDIDWAKKTIVIDIPVVFIEDNEKRNDYEDFYLMTLCKHHIIANSSFSWWGSWLSTNKEKIIIKPENFMN